MNRAKIPAADYAKVAQRFNPAEFDAREWVRIAKSAGMRYIMITSVRTTWLVSTWTLVALNVRNPGSFTVMS